MEMYWHLMMQSMVVHSAQSFGLNNSSGMEPPFPGGLFKVNRQGMKSHHLKPIQSNPLAMVS
jgi:hypothetical protein